MNIQNIQNQREVKRELERNISFFSVEVARICFKSFPSQYQGKPQCFHRLQRLPDKTNAQVQRVKALRLK